MKVRHLLYVVLTLFIFGLSSCGQVDPTFLTGTTDGSGSTSNSGLSGSNTYLAGGGIGGTGITPGISMGRITAFGSIFVNGIEFDTTSAVVRINDMEGNESDLHIGMIVKVEGVYSSDKKTGQAKLIEFTDLMKGPVESIDIQRSTIVVLGKTITIDMDTHIYDSTGLKINIGDIRPGNIVDISGFIDSKGIIHATYISVEKDLTEEIIISGPIENIDIVNKTFIVNDLIVDFSRADIIDPPSGGLSNGLSVKIKGTEGITRNTIVAISIEVEPHLLDVHGGEHVELEGIITKVESQDVFEVNDQPVEITGDTIFENSRSIQLDMRIEVEGTINDKGILVAQKISIEKEEGDSKDVNGGSSEESIQSGQSVDTQDSSLDSSEIPADNTEQSSSISSQEEAYQDQSMDTPEGYTGSSEESDSVLSEGVTQSEQSVDTQDSSLDSSEIPADNTEQSSSILPQEGTQDQSMDTQDISTTVSEGSTTYGDTSSDSSETDSSTIEDQQDQNP